MSAIRVLTPMLREARAIPGAVAIANGMGIDGAVARAVGDSRAPVIVAGVCGALDPSLRVGAIVLARSIVRAGTHAPHPDAALFDAARFALRKRGIEFVSAAMLTVDLPVPDRAVKTDLWNTYGAACVDMESYALVQALDARGIPWLVVRSVVDTTSMSLPPSLHKWTAEQDERALVREIASRPREWAAYAHLALNMRGALKTLAVAVRAITAAAPIPDPQAPQRIEVHTLT